MKKLVLAVGFYMTFCSFIYPQQALFYLGQALLKAGIVKAYATDYRFPLNTTSMVGIFLEQGKSMTITFELKAYTDYALIGVADEDVEDLDLRLITQDGIELVKDNKTNNHPIIFYYNRLAGNKSVEITNYKARTTSFCLLLILEKDEDYYNSIEKFGQAIRNVIDLNAIYNEYNASGTAFIQNTTCLFAGMFESGGSDYFGNFSVPYSTKCMFLGTGSDNISDTDLKISQQYRVNDLNNVRTICEDRSPDRVALISSCFISNNEDYKLEYKNYESTGTGFLISTILRLK